MLVASDHLAIITDLVAAEGNPLPALVSHRHGQNDMLLATHAVHPLVTTGRVEYTATVSHALIPRMTRSPAWSRTSTES